MSSSRDVGLVLACMSVGFFTATLSSERREDTVPATRRYDFSQEAIAGGLGGMMLTVTDHQLNKAFMYLMNNEEHWPPQLGVTIDLTSAGEPTLKVKKNEDRTSVRQPTLERPKSEDQPTRENEASARTMMPLRVPDPLPASHRFKTDKWVGQEVHDLDLATFLDVDLLPVDCHVVFYRQTCKHCAAYLAKLAVEPPGPVPLVLVRVAESNDTPQNEVTVIKPEVDFMFELHALERGYGIETPSEMDVEGLVVTRFEVVPHDH